MSEYDLTCTHPSMPHGEKLFRERHSYEREWCRDCGRILFVYKSGQGAKWIATREFMPQE